MFNQIDIQTKTIPIHKQYANEKKHCLDDINKTPTAI